MSEVFKVDSQTDFQADRVPDQPEIFQGGKPDRLPDRLSMFGYVLLYFVIVSYVFSSW